MADDNGESSWTTAMRAIDMALGTVMSGAPLKMAAGQQPDPVSMARDILREKQLRANAAAGPLTLPGVAAAGVSLIQHGVPAVVSGIATPGPEPIYSKIAQHFSDNLIDEDGKNALAAAMWQHQIDFEKAHPNATIEEKQKNNQDYQNSDEFHQTLNEHLPVGFRLQ